MFIIKLLIGGLLVFMIYNLALAMKIMLKDEKGTPQKMSTFIGRRVLTSAIIVSLILIAAATGVITLNPTPQ